MGGILGGLLYGFLRAFLPWFFSGSRTETTLHVVGLADLDRKNMVDVIGKPLEMPNY